MNTLAELEQKNLIRAETAFGSLEPGGKGIVEVMARWRAGVEFSAYGMIDWHQKQLFPDTAEDAQLERLFLWRGIPRQFGKKAVGHVLLTGELGSLIPAGTTFRTEKGSRYALQSETVLASISQKAAIIALENGIDANGENLPAKMEKVLLGVDPEAKLSATAGKDDETDELYRLRALEVIRNRGSLYGKVGDYAIWAKQASGEVGYAWELPNFAATGTLGIVLLSAGYGDLSEGALENVRTYIETVKQSGVYFQVIQGKLKSFDFRLAIEPNTPEMQVALRSALQTYFKRWEKPAAHISLEKLEQYLAEYVDGLKSLNILAPVVPMRLLVCSQCEIPAVGKISWQ